jgi:hypothetical protein
MPEVAKSALKESSTTTQTDTSTNAKYAPMEQRRMTKINAIPVKQML